MVDEDVEPGTTQVEVFENDFQVDQLTQETFEQRAQFIRNALATIFVYVTGLMLLLGTICSFFNLLPSPGRLFLSLAFAISRLLLIALFAHFHPVDASKVTSLFKCIFLAFVLDSLWYWEMTLRAIAIPSPTLIVAYFISLGFYGYLMQKLFHAVPFAEYRSMVNFLSLTILINLLSSQ